METITTIRTDVELRVATAGRGPAALAGGAARDGGGTSVAPRSAPSELVALR
jgi:hypothetical protein